MDGSSSKLSLFKTLAPKLPGILGAGASHTLGLSETSAKWDLRTALIMATLRSFLFNPKPSPVSRQQELSLRDPGIKGPIWISKQVLPASADDSASVLQSLVSAIEGLADEQHSKTFTTPEIRPVEVEWTGSRATVGKTEPRPDLDEKEHFSKLMSEVTSSVTVLYMHGGALYLMDPATHRVMVSRLAKHTKGRCMSVRYRLAPQNPFPAALLDCFIAYLSLLSPPPGSVHEAVPAKDIVFAGDSAGGNLSLTLLQLILQLHRQNGGATPTVRFHGKDVPVPVPAGLALQSPWADLTRSLPSIKLNAVWDYLPPPQPDYRFAYEPDAIWPATPPRADLYCDDGMMLHPLLSPLTAKDWSGAPPVYICIGQEGMSDESMVMARRLLKSGVNTELYQFEAMPHVFPAVFTDLEGANLAIRKWADAVTRMVAGQVPASTAVWVEAKTLNEKKLDVTTLASQLADEDVDRRLRDAQAKKIAADGSKNEQVMSRL